MFTQALDPHVHADPVDRARENAERVKDKAKEEADRLRQTVNDKAQKVTGRK